jgi:hypothetical protein
VLNGWQFAGVLQLQDGFPFTVNGGASQPVVVVNGATITRSYGVEVAEGASNNPVLGGPEKYFDPSAFRLAPANVLGNLGSNTLIGPGIEELDISLIKTVALRGPLHLQLRADAFNIFNHANFGLPDNTLFTADGTPRPAAGRITTTTTTGREFQFGLKLTF